MRKEKVDNRKEKLEKSKEGDKHSIRYSVNYFLFYLSLFSLLLTHSFLACNKNPTEPKTGTLTGTVMLEGQTDHSGITVAFTPLDSRTGNIKHNENMRRL